MKLVLIAGLSILAFAGSAGADSDRPKDGREGGKPPGTGDRARPAPRSGDAPGKNGQRPGSPRGGEMAARMMQEMDANKDGRINFEEFLSTGKLADVPEKMQRVLFGRFDKNQDGVITRDELPSGNGAPGKRHSGEGFRMLDANRDGRVSKMEFLKSPRLGKIPVENQNEIFNRLDRNHDGFIDGRDRHHGAHPEKGPGRGRPPIDPRMLRAELDRNKDGAVSFEEFSAHPRFGGMNEDSREDLFEKLDTNGDHKLDAADQPADAPGQRMRPRPPEGPGSRDRRPPEGQGPRDRRPPPVNPDV